MQRTTKTQRRAQRKRVRAEKQRLRRRSRKHTPRKWVYMTLTFMELETIEALRKYAREHKMSINKVISKALAIAMKRWEIENGVQREVQPSLDESK